MTPSRDISRLLEIMALLRTPGSGCPWDLEQNFSTIAPYTIEEAYEVADAIARGDLDDLRGGRRDRNRARPWRRRGARRRDRRSPVRTGQPRAACRRRSGARPARHQCQIRTPFWLHRTRARGTGPFA